MSDEAHHSDGSGKANDYRPPNEGQYVRETFPTYDQGRDIEVDRRELERIADGLQQDIQSYLDGPLNELRAKGNMVTLQHLGGSPTAANVLETINLAYSGFVGYLEELRNSYVHTVEKLRRSAKGYGDAEDATEASAAQAGSLSGNQGDVTGHSAPTTDSTTTNTPVWTPR